MAFVLFSVSIAWVCMVIMLSMIIRYFFMKSLLFKLFFCSNLFDKIFANSSLSAVFCECFFIVSILIFLVTRYRKNYMLCMCSVNNDFGTLFIKCNSGVIIA